MPTSQAVEGSAFNVLNPRMDSLKSPEAGRARLSVLLREERDGERAAGAAAGRAWAIASATTDQLRALAEVSTEAAGAWLMLESVVGKDLATPDVSDSWVQGFHRAAVDFWHWVLFGSPADSPRATMRPGEILELTSAAAASLDPEVNPLADIVAEWATANLGALDACGLELDLPAGTRRGPDGRETSPDDECKSITIVYHSEFPLNVAGDVRADLRRWVDTMEGRLRSIRETVESLAVDPFLEPRHD